ncbi:F-box protein [Acorus calamus]|uniref:F-box protein n=1 Tax=Acorus calamus TaxID=4465 RepID=A0AAV9ELZ8_ACOCL|nr:F-box protein [Acorus calamus]
MELDSQSLTLKRRKKQNKSTRAMTSTHSEGCKLNNDLIMEILHRLPTEKVHEFRRVCKQWLAMIDHPCFIEANLARSEPCLLVVQRWTDKAFFIELQRSNNDAVLVVRPTTIDPTFFLQGCCNGLVLAYHFIIEDLGARRTSTYREYFVINPSTKRSIKLPPFCLEEVRTTPNTVHGGHLGFVIVMEND